MPATDAPDAPSRPRNQTAKLTMAAAAEFPYAPRGTDYIVWDTVNTSLGLGLRVYASAKTWFMQRRINGRPVKYRLGAFPGTTLEAAVREARVRIADYNAGLNPHEARRKREAQGGLTVGRAYDEYLEARRADAKSFTQSDRDAARTRLARGQLWRRPIDAITGDDLHVEWQRLLASATRGSGRTVTSTTFRYLRAAWNHAVDRRQLTLASPFRGFAALVPGWSTTNRRSRIVASHEGQLAAWWRGVEALRHQDTDEEGQTRDGRRRHAGTIADYLQLTLLIGPRGGELLPLRWSDVNLDAQLITFRDTKGGRDHTVPYGPYVHDMLTRRHEHALTETRQSEFVFPSSRKNTRGEYSHLVQPRKSLAWIVRQSGVAFDGHDIRRTFATIVNELPGITTTTLERLVNHAPSTVAGQHYVQSRIQHLRPLYHLLEGRILQEAGALPAGYTLQQDLPPQAIAALTTLAAEDSDPDESPTTPPTTPPTGITLPRASAPAIRVRREGAVYIASVDDPQHGRIEAEGATAIAARELLKELL